WLLCLLQLSFVKRFRSTIVHGGDGAVFSRLKALSAGDRLRKKQQQLSPLHRRHRQLAMAVSTNLSCERSLYEELEGQLQVLREFLEDQEAEA
ncbi:unnamed protein product, partial [Phaeothamnion confervicola]